MAMEILMGILMTFLVMVVWLIVIALLVLPVVFWILMIVDCAKRKFKNDNDRILWILVVALVGFIGAVIYYFVIKRPDRH